MIILTNGYYSLGTSHVPGTGLCYYDSPSTDEETDVERCLPQAIELFAQRWDSVFSIWLPNAVLNHRTLLPASFMCFFSPKLWDWADDFISKALTVKLSLKTQWPVVGDRTGPDRAAQEA